MCIRDRKITIPDVDGQTGVDAQQTLEDMGLTVEIQKEYSELNDDGTPVTDPGYAVSTTPAAGNSVSAGDSVTLLAVEGDIPKVAVFLAMPYADKSQAGIQPVLYLKGHRCLYAKLLTVVKVQVFIDFNQPLRGLVKRLYRVVLGVAEPGAEDVLAL